MKIMLFGNVCIDFQRIGDGKLMLMVASLVAIDLVILVIYTLVEGLTGGLVAKRVTHRENPTIVEGVRISYRVEPHYKGHSSLL